MPDRVRLTVPSEERGVSLVTALVERYGEELEVPGPEVFELVEAIVALVRFTLEHAYPDDPTGQIEVTLDVSDGAIAVDVHDWGRPLNSAGGELGPLPAPLAELADALEDLRLVNLGADGKRLSGRKRVTHVLDTGPEAHDFDAPARPPGGGDGIKERIEVRSASPEDAEAIAQLLYTNYHLTYGHPDFYRPRWVAEALASGRLRSTLALHDGELIGHHALTLDEGAASAETGVAVVHPAFRGLGVFNLLFDHTLAIASEAGLAAVWGRAVTVHPYSQRSERSHGYREAALLLGSVPASMAMAGLADAQGARTASLVSYRMLRPVRRDVYLPEAYRHQLRAVYANLGLAERPAAKPAPATPGEAVACRLEEERQTGWLRVTAWREDSEAALRRAVRHLLASHVDVAYADVDLSAVEDVDAAVAALNGIGFFYAGLVPSGPAGHDFARLQLLDSEAVETERIVCDSPFAQALLRDVLEDRARVAG